MTPGPHDAIAPGVTSQLDALLATLAGAALVTLLLRGVLWWRFRGRRAPWPRPAPAEPDQAPARDLEPVLRRLLGALLLAVLALPTAAAIRQLWPHPDLGPRLLVAWLPLVLIPAGTWLLIRRGSPPTRRGP